MKKLLMLMLLVSFMFGAGVKDKVQQERNLVITPGVTTIVVDVLSSLKFQPKDDTIYISLLGNATPNLVGITLLQNQLLDTECNFANKQKITIQSKTTTTNVYYLKTVQ